MTQLSELKRKYRLEVDQTKLDQLIVELNQVWAPVRPSGPSENDAQLHDRFENLLRDYEMIYDQISKLTQRPLWSEVTLDLPGDTPLAVPGGKWQRLDDGAIRATFTPEELALILGEAAHQDAHAKRADF